MIRSIRYFLLISLLISITIASAINGIGNYLLDEQIVQPYLDGQLVRFASLINVINQSTHKNSALRDKVLTVLQQAESSANERFLFQVFTAHGNIILQSLPRNVKYSLLDSPLGFSNQTIQDDEWRVYASTDQKTKMKLIVAERYNLRRELADDIAESNVYILAITYVVFGVLVWLIISFALRSVTRVTNEISHRASTFLEPVQLKEIPVEIKPLVAELNQLFIRLKLAFERNKRFAADAAHELRTPLAALKTHVQVALNAGSDEDREMALKKVLQSVDRSSHVVAQLLTLSRMGEEEPLTDIKPVNLHKIATEIIAYLAPHAFEKNIEIELLPPPPYCQISGNDTALGILIRNVVDNAIRYTPENGEVKVEILNQAHQVVLRVTDTGAGIPEELRERVFERFFRILGNKAQGSGLGLAIVNQITLLHHGRLTLSTPQNGIGLQFDVAFPMYPA